jgi:hypothetical protein
MYLYAKEMLKKPKGYSAGVDPGFQVRGGALKKNAPSGGRREKFWVSRVKNHYFTQKNHIFFQFKGGAGRVRPPLDPPLLRSRKSKKHTQYNSNRKETKHCIEQ